MFNLDSQTNIDVDMHMHIDNHMPLHMGPKKIFPTPVVLSLLHVCCMYAPCLCTCDLGYCLLRISNPGWKNLTFDVLLIVSFESGI